jgi:hypothetical protein
MKLKCALEEVKGKRVEYRKLKDGFLLLERLGLVTPMTDQSTAQLNYGQRFQHRLEARRLRALAPEFLSRCEEAEGDPFTLAGAVLYILRLMAEDDRRRREQGFARTQPWSLDRLNGELAVDLEMQHHRRVKVRRELVWTAAGALTQAGLLESAREGYAVAPGVAARKDKDIEKLAKEALPDGKSDPAKQQKPAASKAARMEKLLAPCYRRDILRATLARDIASEMDYPPKRALFLFTLLRRRMDRIAEDRFPDLLDYFVQRRGRGGGFSLHPADILNDFAPRCRKQGETLQLTKTLKARRPAMEKTLPLPVSPQVIARARLYCTLRHGRPLPQRLKGKRVDIAIEAEGNAIFHAGTFLLDIPDDPLAPVDLSRALRRLTGNPTLTVRFTLPESLPATRLLIRLEATLANREG